VIHNPTLRDRALEAMRSMLRGGMRTLAA